MNGYDKMEHYIVHKGKLFDSGAASNQTGQPKLDLRSRLILGWLSECRAMRKQSKIRISVKLDESDRGQARNFFRPRL